MNEREAFIHQIRESPDDEFPRLVYADYLDEMGDARGELIRLQCKLPQLDVMGDPWRATRERIKKLLNTNAERWLGPLREAGAVGITLRSFQRGLIERVVVNQTGAAESLAALCELEPALHYVELRIQSLEDLATLIVPPQIKFVDVSHNSLHEADAEHLNSLSWTADLRGLVARNCRMGDEQAAALLTNAFDSLESLALDGNRLSWETLDAIAKADWLPQLRQLSLATNNIRASGPRTNMPRGIIEALAKRARQLASLSLSTCSLRDADVEELLDSRGLDQLHSLDLRSNNLSLEIVAAFAKQQACPALTELDLRAAQPRFNSRHYGSGSDPKLEPVIQQLRERYGEGAKV